MATPKYKVYYQKMIDDNRALFDQFSVLNKAFAKDQASGAAEFHQVGQQILDIIRDFDRRLCAAMGKGVYSVYSEKLSQKFWDLVRQDFSQIDMVGVKIKKS
jgi:hypothetical protein